MARRICSCLLLLLAICPGTCVAAQSQDATSIEAFIAGHYQAGLVAFRDGEFREAANEFKTVLRVDPDLTAARLNLGLAYHSLGQYKLASLELTRALHRQPDLKAANLFLGIDYLKLGRPSMAVGPLRTSVQEDRSNRVAREALATCYLDQDQYRQAAEQFRALSSLQIHPADGLYILGKSYLNLAKHIANRLSRHFQISGWADRLAGDLLVSRQDWTDAAVLYRQALASDPRQPGLHISLGKIYLRQGKLQTAAAEFHSSLRLDPQNEEAWLGLAEVQLANWADKLSREGISAILDMFLTAPGDQPVIRSTVLSPAKANLLIGDLKRSPADNPAAHFLLGWLYQTTGKSTEARKQTATFQSMLSAWQNADGGRQKVTDQPCISYRDAACVRELQAKSGRSAIEGLQLGKAFMSLENYSLAADAFADALEKDKANLPAMYWLARSYMRLADGCFDELLQRFPQSWRAYQFRGESDEVHQDYEAAITQFQMAAQIHPADAELWEALGRVYFANKSFVRADEAIQHSLELEPALARSYYLLARIELDHRHHAQQSLTYFQAAIHYDPNLLEARAGLGQAFMHLGEPQRALRELEQAASIDRYGDIHYLLYVAYGRLGNSVLARRALARSQALRKNSAASYVAKVAEATEEESQN